MKNIIIIGSGIGGLVAGNLLAKKGHKVTIFESHSKVKSDQGYIAVFDGIKRKTFVHGEKKGLDADAKIKPVPIPWPDR